MSLLSQSRGTVTESVALHPTALRSSLPTQARGGRNDDPGQRGDRWCGPSIAAGPCSDLSATSGGKDTSLEMFQNYIFFFLL